MTPVPTQVRIQLAAVGPTAVNLSPLAVVRNVVASGRILDLYTGLSAGLVRQAVYTTARIGLFDSFIGAAGARAKEQNRALTFAERGAAGLAAGGLAAIVGNPADLALIR